VLLAAEILRNCKQFVEEGVHPQVIVKSLRLGTRMAIDKIKEISMKISHHDKSEQRSLLIKCAATTLSSKLVAHSKEFFANMVVDAVMMLDELLPLNMIGIKKVQGGALEESRLIAGVAFKKTFSYAGFEMQPKKSAFNDYN
jgi:T-complex protein 1 subunit eta